MALILYYVGVRIETVPLQMRMRGLLMLQRDLELL